MRLRFSGGLDAGAAAWLGRTCALGDVVEGASLVGHDAGHLKNEAKVGGGGHARDLGKNGGVVAHGVEAVADAVQALAAGGWSLMRHSRKGMLLSHCGQSMKVLTVIP